MARVKLATNSDGICVWNCDRNGHEQLRCQISHASWLKLSRAVATTGHREDGQLTERVDNGPLANALILKECGFLFQVDSISRDKKVLSVSMKGTPQPEASSRGQPAQRFNVQRSGVYV
jgi:hypothetical protein